MFFVQSRKAVHVPESNSTMDLWKDFMVPWDVEVENYKRYLEWLDRYENGYNQLSLIQQQQQKKKASNNNKCSMVVIGEYLRQYNSYLTTPVCTDNLKGIEDVFDDSRDVGGL